MEATNILKYRGIRIIVMPVWAKCGCVDVNYWDNKERFEKFFTVTKNVIDERSDIKSIIFSPPFCDPGEISWDSSIGVYLTNDTSFRIRYSTYEEKWETDEQINKTTIKT